MAKLFEAAKLALNEQLQRYRNKPFLEAMMAATAFLALADDKVLLSQRLALDYVLANIKELRLFDVHKAVNMFSDYGEAIKNDYDAGKEKVFKAVAKFSGDKAKASLIIRACVLIAKADGHFSEAEQRVVDELCRVLAMDSSEVCMIEAEAEAGD
jgi:tellurite resistance protein TerB